MDTKIDFNIFRQLNEIVIDLAKELLSVSDDLLNALRQVLQALPFLIKTESENQ